MTQHYPGTSFTAQASPVRLNAPAPQPYATLFKRILDLALVLVALPVVLPVLIVVAALAASDGHSPFFRQPRIGRNGRRFAMLKIRTMVPDAEAKLERHLAENPEAAAEWARDQKLHNDPRITRAGAFLRRSSLDELPQLWNVLIGDMSLVGPRPMLPQQRPLYPGNAYETLRPGITGLWQVEARNSSAFADRAIYDTTYANTLSLATDIKILAKTLNAVLNQTGH